MIEFKISDGNEQNDLKTNDWIFVNLTTNNQTFNERPRYMTRSVTAQ